MALEHEALTERIIQAAIEVHRRLVPGFLESVQATRLAAELREDNPRTQASHCVWSQFLPSCVPHFDRLKSNQIAQTRVRKKSEADVHPMIDLHEQPPSLVQEERGFEWAGRSRTIQTNHGFSVAGADFFADNSIGAVG